MPRRNLPRVPERHRSPGERVLDFDEVTIPYTEDEARREAARCLRCRRAPCTLACPLGTRADAYVPLIAEGRFAEAAAIIAETDPFPAVCARVCHHPCEDVCLAAKVDGAVAIRALKRFVVDATGRAGAATARPSSLARPGADARNPVAIVGAGPGGLSAARELAALGYHVVVFDALPEPGGLLRWGIPAFRLPRPVAAAAVDAIEASGVVFQTEMRLGRDFTLGDLFCAGYRAVLLAIGAHRSQRLDVPGEDLPWVLSALDFLRQVAAGTPPPCSGPVVVIGGGDAAIDAARSARRLGAAEVTIVYRRSKAEMPARPEEIIEAEEEGIGFRFLAAPVAMCEEPDGKRTVLFQDMRLTPAAGGGRPQPVPVPGSCWKLTVSLAVVGVGQVPDPAALPGSLRPLLQGRQTSRETPEVATPVAGIFLCGDAGGHRANVTDAAASGRRAARAIHQFLSQASGKSPMQPRQPALTLAGRDGMAAPARPHN